MKENSFLFFSKMDFRHVKISNLLSIINEKKINKKFESAIAKNIYTKDKTTKKLKKIQLYKTLLNYCNISKNMQSHFKYAVTSLSLKLTMTNNIDPQYHNVLLEIRTGTGGLESSLFSSEVFHMYLKLSEKMKWFVKIITYTSNTKKGIKESILKIQGLNVYSYLKYESGIHRVQRIPATESQGRIHTSACSVFVVKDRKKLDPVIKNQDLRIDVFRSSGPGGQSVNTTDSAVRIMHIPTKIITQCQNEKSQVRNKLAALKILQLKLKQYYTSLDNVELSQKRKMAIRSGNRSEKIRTYNFPQDRCTDHRSGITEYNLGKIFSGNLDKFIKKNKEYIDNKKLI